MKVKEAAKTSIPELYDIHSLVEIDSIEDRLIIEPRLDDANVASDVVGLLNADPSYITERIKNAESGKVYLVVNEFFTKKYYVLYLQNNGLDWVKLLYTVNMDIGSESSFVLNEADYNFLKTYKIFETDSELAFFMAAQEGAGLLYPLHYKPDSTSVAAAMGNMKPYLDKGLWLASINMGHHSIDAELSPGKNIRMDIFKGFLESNGIRYISEYNNSSYHIININGTNVLAKLTNNSFMIVGNYETVKGFFCKHKQYTVFGCGFFYNPDITSPLLENFLDYLTAIEEPINKEEKQQIKEEIKKEMTSSSTDKPADFWESQEKLFEKAQSEAKQKKANKRKEKFSITSEVSQGEKEQVIQETPEKPAEKIKLPTRKSQRLRQIADALKTKEKLKTEISTSYPTDWNKVLDIKETSSRYNLTIGQRYDASTGSFIMDENQGNGMTLEEWNAYFLAKPELSHLIDAAIGAFGGIVFTERDLMESGHLLYNPKTKKLEYKHDYLRGNAYSLMEDFENVKEEVIQLYGDQFYNKQVEIIDSAKPKEKLLLDPEPRNVPYIHPLDEVVIDFKVNNAANMTFPKSVNRKIMRAYWNARKSSMDPESEEEQLVGQELQSLSITVFFRKWLVTQYGKLAGYGIPSSKLLDDIYFFGMTFKKFALEAHEYNIKVNDTEQITESDFYEMKDNVKRFVNDLFQEFLKTEISEDDRTKIETAWNKRYNGFINLNIWKYPIFIRHSKYLKDRAKGLTFDLSRTQVEGIKFATINNGSIIAHDVGFGKTLISICYISHMFETNQANNIMVLVPKALYANNKWKEELGGDFDEKRNRFLIGAIPQYNLIELSNFSTTTIFGEGKTEGESKYKNYSDDDIYKIRKYAQLITEIGGKQRSKQAGRRTPGTATLPTTPYNFKKATATSGAAWTKILDLLKKMDAPLLARCRGKIGPEMEEMLDLFASFDIGTNAKEKNERILTLQDSLNEIRYKHQYWLPIYGTTVPFNPIGNSDLLKNLDSFLRSDTSSYRYEKDKKTGKPILKADKEGVMRKVERPHKLIAEEYVMDVLEELHGWVNSVLEKMYDFGVYEYGSWNFSQERHNIILATRDSLVNLGFSEKSREGVTNVIKEITEYKNEVNYDTEEVIQVNYMDELGEVKKYVRNPERVMQKQLAELTQKISQNMTEEGKYGKFFLENLNIDGFILDEAHIGKKIFNNVKTSASTPLLLEDGKEIRINTTSHDIRGGGSPNRALSVFALCQYIRSMGDNKPIMMLTATPFSNQPTEIFSMLAMVGIKQLREQGISNIKNFFDLFLKETLKYDFDHNGEFIKRIAVEDFRNKELLSNVIWSIIDIKREASLDAAQKNKDRKGAKPTRIVYPKLTADSSMEITDVSEEEEEDIGLRECEMYGKISTVAVVNRLAVNTCSIVDRNDIQKKMMEDIEKVVTNQPNPNKPVLDDKGKPMAGAFHLYTFDDICPNSEIFAEVEDKNKADDDAKKRKTKKEIREEAELKIKVSKRDEYGKVFKGLGLSRAIALSPYLFRCNELPEPTAENLIKYSPKIEYLVKAIESVKNYHLDNIPKKVEQIKKEIAVLEQKSKLSQEEQKDLQSLKQRLPHLEAAQEVSGQLVYLNMLRFKYYSRDEKGKAQVTQYNIAELIKEYLVNKGVFEKHEIAIFSSDTSDDLKEDYVKGFQDGTIKLFFGTPAMREGVDLQNKASTLYVMTPDWNPTDMRQIEGRIWRRDNENAYIRVVYVLLDQSIEVFIYAKLEEKSRRLQKIMKERNTIAEIEEMSLDPNQTKVALASDPVKRADIVTKLCEAVLIDRRNKISKTREELVKVTGQLDSIYTNIEVIRDNYIKPYFEYFPGILKEYADFRKKEIISLYMNDRYRFIRSFAQSFTGRINDQIDMLLDLMSGGFFEASIARADMEYGNPLLKHMYFATNYKLETTYDILNGLKAIIEHKQEFTGLSFKDSIALFNTLVPMRYATGDYETNGVNNYLFATGFVSGGFVMAEGRVRIFSGQAVMNLSENSQKVVLKTIGKIFNTQMPSREKVVDSLLGAAGELQEVMKAELIASNDIRPEMHKDYKRYTQDFEDFKVISDDEFEKKNLFEKIEVINGMNLTVRNRCLSVFRTFPKETQAQIVDGTYPKPTLAKLIPLLGLDATLKKGQYDQLEELMRPFNDLRYVMRDIESTYLKPRNLGIDDLPKLMDDINFQHKEISGKIDALQVSKEKLIERFQKIAESRKSISIDAIVAKFGETNSFLEYKLS